LSKKREIEIVSTESKVAGVRGIGVTEIIDAKPSYDVSRILKA